MSDHIARAIEHTNLKPTASEHDIVRLCAEAVENGFHGVCVHGSRVAVAARALAGTDLAVVSVVGFPLGACATAVKTFETELAVAEGAHEIDMVLALGWFLEGAPEAGRDIAAVVQSAGECPVKVILETGHLTTDQITAACHLAREAGAAFVKTSTGFGPRGAKVDDIRTMRAAVGDALGIKASGGIRLRAEAEALMAAGADRLGTSSGVLIAGSTE